MPNELEVFYSSELVNAIKEHRSAYVYHETGLTLNTCYSESDLAFYQTVAAEFLPVELNNFISTLAKEHHGMNEDGIIIL